MSDVGLINSKTPLLPRVQHGSRLASVQRKDTHNGADPVPPTTISSLGGPKLPPVPRALCVANHVADNGRNRSSQYTRIRKVRYRYLRSAYARVTQEEHGKEPEWPLKLFEPSLIFCQARKKEKKTLTSCLKKEKVIDRSGCRQDAVHNSACSLDHGCRRNMPEFRLFASPSRMAAVVPHSGNHQTILQKVDPGGTLRSNTNISSGHVIAIRKQIPFRRSAGR